MHSTFQVLAQLFADLLEQFNYYGCGSAKTPIQAAEYIENFVAHKRSRELNR
jgi:hypothetical protein